MSVRPSGSVGEKFDPHFGNAPVGGNLRRHGIVPITAAGSDHDGEAWPAVIIRKRRSAAVFPAMEQGAEIVPVL
jgi:hypothetical protein